MKQYLGVKLINSMPMTRLEYNKMRGWELPANENADDEGYLVEYLDGGQANTVGYSGYVSWSPKNVFEKAYRQIDHLTFGLAIEALKLNKKVSRLGWNGKNQWLIITDYTLKTKQTITDIPLGLPWVGIKTSDNKFVPWFASQTDMLAEDWIIMEDN